MTDWPALIFELNRLGMRDAEIEKSCEFSNGYLAHLKDGTTAEPTHSRGQKLLQLVEEKRRAKA